MVVGLLGNESSDSNRFTLVTPKSENDVRLQATLGNQNPTGLPVGVVSNKLPGIADNVRVGFGTPNRAGLYTVTAVTDNKNYEPGVYTMTAVTVGGNYQAAPIIRTFTITK